jgi:hypothetical protein
MEVSGEVRAKDFPSTSLDIYHFLWGFVRKSNKRENLLQLNTNIPPLYKFIKNTANGKNVKIISTTASFNEPS